MGTVKRDRANILHFRSALPSNQPILSQIACIRLAAIDGVGGDTGVKPQHRLRHLPTAAPSLTVI